MGYIIGQAFGSAAAVFVTAVIVTFIIKKIVIAFAKGERKESIETNFLVLKTSMMFAGVAALLSIIGVSSNAIGYYGLPAMIVVDFIIANSK